MPLYKISDGANSVGVITQQINPTIVFSTNGNWTTTPSSLSNAIDNDVNTSTDYGEAGGFNGAAGYINLDLSQEVSWLHCVFKIGIKKQTGGNNTVGNWGIDSSIDNTLWTTSWGYLNKTGVSDTTELILVKNFTVKDTTRYLRFWSQDIGAYGAGFKIYDIKFYTLA